MFNRSNFADADAGPDEADFVIVGAPFDATTSFRPGTRDGPGAVRRASYNFETYVHRHRIDFRDINVADLGDLDLGADPAYARETIRESFAFIPGGATPIFIGGEHSITPPSVGAARAAPTKAASASSSSTPTSTCGMSTAERSTATPAPAARSSRPTGWPATPPSG